MASAAITSELSASVVSQSAVAAAWWRRFHSYAFITVAAGEMLGTWLVVRLIDTMAAGGEEIATAAMIGFLLAQCFLLGLWAALGGLGTVPRWLIVGCLTTVGALAVTLELVTSGWQEFLQEGPIFALLACLTTAGFAVVLLPLRALAGWRVDFDQAYHPGGGRRRGQIGLMDFAALFCAVALPLTLGRALAEITADAAQFAMIVPIFCAIVLATAGPVAYAALARRRIWLWLAGCTAWLAGICVLQSTLAAIFPDLDIFGTNSSMVVLNWTVVAFHLGVTATVALPLLVLRAFGLKLIAVS